MRSDELKIEAINRLQSALDIANDKIIPAAIAQQNDDLDPRVSVAASLDSSSRDNLSESTTGTVRVITDGTKDYVEENGTLALSRIQSDVIDELTENRSGWQAEGLNTEEDISWSDAVNRYLGVIEVEVADEDLHPHYQ